jgi:hypothetical protein
VIPDPKKQERPEKPLSAAFLLGGLSPLQVKKALALARRNAAPGQVPTALYTPKHGAALIVLEADDLGALLSELAQGRV